MRWSSPIPYLDRSVRYAIDQNAGAERVIALSGRCSGHEANDRQGAILGWRVRRIGRRYLI
jgi:hypothetical protein